MRIKIVAGQLTFGESMSRNCTVSIITFGENESDRLNFIRLNFFFILQYFKKLLRYSKKY